MGCDIKAHFEIKVGGKWLYYSSPNIERNLDVFEKMTGQKDDFIPFPKGMPDDVSEMTDLHYKWARGNPYTESSLDANGIALVIAFHKKLYEDVAYPVVNEWGYLFGNGWENFNKDRDSYPEEIDIRLVFWFEG